MPGASSSKATSRDTGQGSHHPLGHGVAVVVTDVPVQGRGEVPYLNLEPVRAFRAQEVDSHGLPIPGGPSILLVTTDDHGNDIWQDLTHPDRALDQDHIGFLTRRRSSFSTAATSHPPPHTPAGSTTSPKRTAVGPPPQAAERKRTRSQSVIQQEPQADDSNRDARSSRGRGRGSGRGRGRGKGTGMGRGGGRQSLTPISDAPSETGHTTPVDEKPGQQELGSRLRSGKFKNSFIPVPAPTPAASREHEHEDEAKPTPDALGGPSTFSISIPLDPSSSVHGPAIPNGSAAQAPPLSPSSSRPAGLGMDDDDTDSALSDAPSPESGSPAIGSPGDAGAKSKSPPAPLSAGQHAGAANEDAPPGPATVRATESTRSASGHATPLARNEQDADRSRAAHDLEGWDPASIAVGSTSEHETLVRNAAEQTGARGDQLGSPTADAVPPQASGPDDVAASTGRSPASRSVVAKLELPDGPETIDKASRIDFAYAVSMEADMDSTSSEDDDVLEPPTLERGEEEIVDASAIGIAVDPPVEEAATEVTARSPSVPSGEAPIDLGGKTPKPNEPAADSDGPLVAGDSPLSARVASPRQATPAHTPPPTVDQQLRSASLQTNESFAHLALESPALATGPEERSAPSRPETPTPPLGGTERDCVADGGMGGSPVLELARGSSHQPEAVETDREPKVVDEVAHRPVESAGSLQAGPPRFSLAPLAPSSSAPELAKISSDRLVALDRTSSYPSTPFARPKGFLSPPSTEQHPLAAKVGAHASGVQPAVMEVASETPTPEVNPRQVRAAVAPSPPKEHVGETAFSGQAKTPPMLLVEYASSPPSTPARQDASSSESGLLAGRARLGELDVGTPRDEDLSPLNRSARDALRAAEVTPSPGAALYPSAGPSRLSISGLPQRWATQEPSAPDMGPLLPALRITTSLPQVRPSLDEIAGREGRERLPSSAPPSSPPLDADPSLFTPPSDRSPEPDFDARRTRPGSEINDHPMGSSLKSDLAAGPLPRPGGRNEAERVRPDYSDRGEGTAPRQEPALDAAQNVDREGLVLVGQPGSSARRATAGQQSKPHVESSDDEPVVTRPPGSGKARSRKNRPLHPPRTYKKTKQSGQPSTGPSIERPSTVRVNPKSRRVLSASEDEPDDFGTSSHLAPSTVRTSSSQALATVGSSRTSGNQLSERTPVDDEPKSLRIKLKRPDQQTLETAETETRKQKKRVKRDRRVIEKLATKKDGPRDGEEDMSKRPRPEPATSTDMQVHDSLTRTTKRESANKSEREGTQKEAGPVQERSKHEEVIVLDDESKSPLPIVRSQQPKSKTNAIVEQASAPYSPKPQTKPKPSLPRKSFNLADLAKGPSKPGTSSKPPDREQTTAIDKKQEDEIAALKKAYFAEVDKDYDKPLDIDAQGDVMREFETFQEAHLNLKIKPPFRVTPYSFPHGPTGCQIAEQFKKETQQQQHRHAQQHTTQSPRTALVNAEGSDIDAPLPYPKNPTEATDFNVRWVEEMEGKWGEREAVEAYMKKHGWGDLNLTLSKGLGWGFWG